MLNIRPPKLVRMMLLHAAIGFGLATLFIAALLRFDPGGIGALLLNVGGAEAIGLLWLFCGLTFGAVQIGFAVMALDTSGGGRRGGRLVWPARRPSVGHRLVGDARDLALIPVRSKPARRSNRQG